MSELDELRAEAEALGVKVDGRWGIDRLRAEVSAAQPEAEDDDEPADEPEADDEITDEEAIAALVDELEDDAPTVHRAGGHVDYGDGRGWVLDTEE